MAAVVEPEKSVEEVGGSLEELMSAAIVEVAARQRSALEEQ
jgi:hypothetical protein